MSEKPSQENAKETIEQVDTLGLQGALERAAVNMTARVERASESMDKAASAAAANVTASAEKAAEGAHRAAALVESHVDPEGRTAKVAASAAEYAERAASNVASRAAVALESRLPTPMDVAQEQPDCIANRPKVSVIVPFYNAEETLHRTLQGLRNQTYRNLEIIVIDDGSTDNGAAEALRVAQIDSRVHLIRKENTGVSDTRNVGLNAAKGEWIYFMDADDWLVQDCVETLVAYALRYETEFVIADFYRVAKGLVGHKHGPATGLFTTAQFLRYMGRRPANHYFASLWNKLFKRENIKKAHLRFDTKISFGEDHVFILNYLRTVDTVALVDKPLYYYIDREGSLVHQGLNPFGAIKMKWDTFWPYLHLFNDQGLYRGLMGRLRVYKYALIPCMDHFVDRGDAPFEPKAVFGRLEE